MRQRSNKGETPTKIETFALFIVHQLVSTYGICISARTLIDAQFRAIRHVAPSLEISYWYWTLTGPPVFLAQVLFALALGWLVGRRFQHRTMLWVWVAPTAFLCYALAAIPTLTPNVLPLMLQSGAGQSAFFHYFGTGCRQQDFCFDQILVTLPFYTSVAYSGGALLARFVLRRSRPTPPPAELAPAVH